MHGHTNDTWLKQPSTFARWRACCSQCSTQIQPRSSQLHQSWWSPRQNPPQCHLRDVSCTSTCFRRHRSLRTCNFVWHQKEKKEKEEKKVSAFSFIWTHNRKYPAMMTSTTSETDFPSEVPKMETVVKPRAFPWLGETDVTMGAWL